MFKATMNRKKQISISEVEVDKDDFSSDVFYGYEQRKFQGKVITVPYVREVVMYICKDNDIDTDWRGALEMEFIGYKESLREELGRW